MVLDLLWRVKLDLPLLELLKFVRCGRTYRGLRPLQVESVHDSSHRASVVIFRLAALRHRWTCVHSDVRVCRGDSELF